MDDGPDMKSRDAILQVSFWRIRLRLWQAGARDFWSEFASNRIGILGFSIILLFCTLAALHPVLMHTLWDPKVYDPLTPSLPNPPPNPAPPSPAHLLGTDPYGNDILSQLMYGAGTALLLGTVAAVVTVVIATLAGAAAAYFGGAVDVFFMRLADLILMTPILIVLMVLSTFFNLQLLQLAFWIGVLSGLGGTTVVVKAQALQIKNRPFIEAARAAGGSDGYILYRHILPHLMPISLLYMMFTVTEAVFAEAVLSYFGLLSVKASWGTMIHTAAASGYLLRPETWWLVLPAALCITLLCSSFYLVGRSLDEVANPRLRQHKVGDR
jgi:peptide/nickel transport system permease protein